jgi:hypothetical protein
MDIIEIKVDGITTSTTVNRERNTGLVRFQEVTWAHGPAYLARLLNPSE